MTVSEILTLVNFIISKETSGDALVPANYNPLLKEVNTSLFNEFWDKYVPILVQSQLQYLLSDSPLNVFIETDTINCTKATGLATLPTDLIHLGSVISTSTGFNIDLVTPTEASRRRGSVMTIPASIRPYGFIQGGQLQVFPYNQSSASSGGVSSSTVPLDIVYLRLPTTPYYDYCQSNTSLKRVFMPEGSRVYLSDSLVPCLYDSGDNLLESSVTKSGTYPISSTTVELEWRENIHDKFISRILSKTGMSLSEEKIAAYAELMKKTE